MIIKKEKGRLTMIINLSVLMIIVLIAVKLLYNQYKIEVLASTNRFCRSAYDRGWD